MRLIRSFAAIRLPEAYQDGLARLIRELGPKAPARLGWTRPGAWHCTLKFLGGVPESGEEGLPAVIEALAAVRFAPFPLRGRGAGFFPGAKAPRVVWIGVDEGKKECAALAARVDKALEPLGFSTETRPFTPHLTLARVKREDGGPEKSRPARHSGTALAWRALADGLAALDWPVFTAAGFTLFCSVPGPQGPVYSPLAEFPADA